MKKGQKKLAASGKLENVIASRVGKEKDVKFAKIVVSSYIATNLHTMHYHSLFVFGSTRKKISKINACAWAKDALIFSYFFLADPKTNALYLLNK